MEKYTVVEAVLELGNKEDEQLMSKAISIFLDDCGTTGAEFTEHFDSVNCSGILENNQFLVTFIGAADDFGMVEENVRQFLSEFKEELHNEDLEEDWIEELESEHVPSFAQYEILEVRPYQP